MLINSYLILINLLNENAQCLNYSFKINKAI